MTRPTGLTTQVLDTALGCPAAGLRIDVSQVDADGRTRFIKTVRTDADGRTDAPLFGPGEMEVGRYELLFHVGEYFRTRGSAVPDPPFLDVVPVRFAAANGGHYHVPLLVSPYGYVTYRAAECSVERRVALLRGGVVSPGDGRAGPCAHAIGT